MSIAVATKTWHLQYDATDNGMNNSSTQSKRGQNIKYDLDLLALTYFSSDPGGIDLFLSDSFRFKKWATIP